MSFDNHSRAAQLKKWKLEVLRKRKGLYNLVNLDYVSSADDFFTNVGV